jgi:hypothetical protein
MPRSVTVFWVKIQSKMALIGNIEPFQPGVTDLSSYLERMNFLFMCNVVEEDQKVPLFLTLIGAEAYSVLKDLVSPDLPSSNWECFVCKKEGHKSKVCRKRKNKVNLVEEVEDEQSSVLTLKQVLLKETVENSELSQSINKVNVKSAPVFCKNFVNNVSLVMEVDTGAAVSLICEEFYDKHFSNVPLKSSPGLEAVAGLPISPSGEIPVTCQLKTEFPRVFAEDKRTNITGIEAQLVLKEGASMILHKAYSVPYKIKDKLEKELKSMIDNGISVRVSHAEMASPIVCVPKPNGAIRVCVYFKKTLNPALRTDSYPFPSLDEIWQTLPVEKKVSTFVNNQHTPRFDEVYSFTLRRVECSCYLQSNMEKLLKGLPVGIYLDDIITAENECYNRVTEVARWPHGCRRQCSEVAVPALMGSNPTEGGGFFRRKETPPGHGCVCMSSRG